MGIVINSSTGEIDVAASTPGTYRITYTTSNCVNSSTQDITINALPTVAISGTLSYCNGSNTTLTATAGLSSYLWSTGETTQAINVTAGSYTVTGTDANGCSATSSSVTVTELPLDDASFSYSANSYCQNAASNPTTTPATPGGTFSSTTGLSINSTTGEINLAASTVGNYVVTYNTPSGNACPNSSTQNVEVLAADVASLSYPASSYPQSGTDPSPTFSPQNGGTFTATPSGLSINSSTGVIDLSASSVNSYTITYTSGGTCSDTATFNLSIISISAAFNYSASAYCQDASDPTPTITGTSGGAFSAAIKVIPFQMQFEVSSGAEKTIEIYATSTGNFTIDWGDNSTVLSNYTAGTISHTYNAGNVGTTVDPIISIGAQNDDPIDGAKHTTNSRSDLIDIPQWGNMEFGIYQFQDRFQGCNNSRFKISATDAPIIKSPNWNMRKLFYYATHFNSDISHWNADAGTVFSQAFMGSNFNQPLNSWDVSRVTTFSTTFQSTPFNQDLSGWDTQSATTFYYMFNAASSFNQNLSDWNISSLGNATRMFKGCTSLTDENYTDTVVGWAVFVYNNGGSPSSVQWTGAHPSFDGTRTSDLASGQTYAAKYGANWTATGWTDSQDAYDYLTTTLSWSIN